MCVQRYFRACDITYVCTMLCMCVQCCLLWGANFNTPLLIIFGNLRTLPPVLLLIWIHPSAYQFFCKMYTKKLTFITQFHTGILLQIHCVFSENLTLGECLYIWSMMHILPHSFNKMFYFHKQRLSYFYIFWLLAAPCCLLRCLRLLNSWSGSDLPPFTKTPRLFGTLEYVCSMLFMCVQYYVMCVQWYLCTFNAI